MLVDGRIHFRAQVAAAAPIIGTSSADVLTGTAGDDEINGRGGDDTLHGLGGNDNLDGWAGADRMEGGDGNDTYFVDDAGDEVIETAGEAGGVDLVNSALDFTPGNDVENLRLWASAQSGYGNELGNLIVGNSADNVLCGNAGNDTLEGRAGDDIFLGWDPELTYSDTYSWEISDDGEDIYSGGEGNDTYVVPTWVDNSDWVMTDMYSPNVTANLAKGVVRYDGFSWDRLESIENITTGEGNDTVRGSDVANAIYVGGGLNDVRGLGGDDRIVGGYVYDDLGEDDDFVLERLDGGAGDDLIDSGGSYWELPTARSYDRGMGTDLLFGRAGDDHLIGREGHCVMNGGSGSDTFEARADLFEYYAWYVQYVEDVDAGSVVIRDFDPREGDRIILRTGINRDMDETGREKADVPDFIGRSKALDYDEVAFRTVRGDDGHRDTVITYRYFYENDSTWGADDERGMTKMLDFTITLEDYARRVSPDWITLA